MKNDQKTVIVLGMHRSGTSVTAGALRILGVDMGGELLGKSLFNLKGHFEDKEFFSLNEKILSSIGKSWDKPPSDILKYELSDDLKNEIKELVKKDKLLWGWKDPRTALTAEFYISYVKNPHFIVCLRNPWEIAKSLEERDGFDVIKGLELTNIYNKHIISILKKHPSIPRSFVAFEDLINHPAKVTQELADFFNINLNDEKKSKVNHLIVPNKQRQEIKSRMNRELEQKSQRELIRVKQELNNIYSSRSWRMISFLRRVKKSLPILKRL